MLALVLLPTSTIPLFSLRPPPVVSSRQFICMINVQNSDDFASAPSSSTRTKITGCPIDLIHEITHRTVDSGGLFDFPGIPIGYDVVPQLNANADVNPRIDTEP